MIDDVGNDVVRYFFNMRNISSHMNFDLTLAKKQSDENPVFYLQYAHARICSIIRTVAEEKIKSSVKNLDVLIKEEEQQLINKLNEYEEVVLIASENYEPHRICTYLTELATAFHKFYTFCRILGSEKKLAEAQKQLLDSAHKAGMADIATGILHNLGNVLNSVNSSAEKIIQIVRTGKVKSFINANQLLKEHMDDIGEFLSADDKGKKLPEFYLKLGDVLMEENSRIVKNMKRIEDKISTMKGIVETQQDYARAEFHSEKEELPKIISDVMKIQKDLIESNGYFLTKYCVGIKGLTL